MNSQDFTVNAPGHLEMIPEGVQAFVPDPLPPPGLDLSKCLAAHEKASMSLGGLKNLIETVPAAQELIESFLRREAVRSSQIEGTKTQLGQLVLFEVGEADDATIDTVDAEQVHRNLEAFKFGIEEVQRTVVYGGLLKKTHAVLFKGANTLTKRPGEYRKASTRIAGTSFETARFVPAPAERVEQCMKEWDEFVNIDQNNSHLPVLIQLALMHYQFETIHPFSDGNGRIGRLAIPLLLKARDFLPQPILCLSAYMDDHRGEYTDKMLAVSQRGEWSEWITFFLRAVQEQADDDILRCKKLIELRDRYIHICGDRSIPIPVIERLFEFPGTKITTVATEEGVNYQTGRRYVEDLTKEGVLSEITGRQTHKTYLAQQIIDLLEKPL